MYRTDDLLRKLEPLMRDRVAAWKKTLDLVDPEVRRLVERQIVSTAYRTLGNFHDKLLLSLPPKKRAHGEYHLGTVLYEQDKWPAGLSAPELLQNMTIFGRSGAGKTNVTFLLLDQLTKKGIPFLYLDWKRTARHLIPGLRKRLDVYTPGRSLSPFPFNPFLAPPGVEAPVYQSQVIDVLGDAYTLGDGSRSLLRKALGKCGTQPTVAKLIEVVEAIPDTERVRGWKVSTLRALESLEQSKTAGEFGQSQMVESLLRRSTVLELDGLSTSNKRFLLPLLCFWVYSAMLTSAKREQLGFVIFVEEAHHVFYQHRQRETLMEMLLRQCREIGIGMIIIDQHPSLISSAALGNAYTSLCLNLKDPTDIAKAASLSLLREGEREKLSMLPVGQGVVKLQDRWHRPFLIRIPHVHVAKGAVTDDHLQRYLRRRSALSALRGPTSAEFNALARPRGSDKPLEPDAGELLQDIRNFPDDGVDVRYRRLSFSADKGNRLKQDLLRRGLVKEEIVRVGRTRRKLLRARTSERRHARSFATESIAHDFWKKRYAERYRRRGFKVQLEAPRPAGGRTDVLATRASESVAIEIETGKSNAASNVRLNLLSGYQQVQVVAVDSSAYYKVDRELTAAGLHLPQVVLRRAEDR